MKRVRVYKEIISDENLRLAIREVNAGHRRNGNHSLNKKVIEIENNMDEYVEKLRAFHQQVLDRHYQPKTMFALKKVVRKECRRLQALYPPYQAA